MKFVLGNIMQLLAFTPFNNNALYTSKSFHNIYSDHYLENCRSNYRN